MAENTIILQKTFPIYNADGSSFHNLVMKKATYESAVMAIDDKITGDVYYKDNELVVTMNEYIEIEEGGTRFYLLNPPTIVREGVVSANNGLNGMTKYSFVFYHPMYMLGNFPFTDIAVNVSEEKYLSQNKTFAWIGNLFDFVLKLNANLHDTEWYVETNITEYEQGSSVHTAEWDRATNLSEVLSFDKQFVSDALKEAYDAWKIPFVITDKIQTIDGVPKKYVIEFGNPSQEILGSSNQPFIFQFGQGVGLKNNSRTPTNNKIVTRIVGYGEERNITWGYPQIPWYGDQSWEYTKYQDWVIVTDQDTGEILTPPAADAYPLYLGVYDGKWTKLIKHPFTRKTLMPYVYRQSVFNKVSPYLPRDVNNPTAPIVDNPDYDPTTPIVDYCDAVNEGSSEVYPNPINPLAPSVEIHEFEGVYPRLGDTRILDAKPVDVAKLTEGVAVVQNISSYISYLTNLKEDNELLAYKASLQSLIDYLTGLNASTATTYNSYYAKSGAGDSYQYECIVSPKRESSVDVWIVQYTSAILNIMDDYVIKDSAAADIPWDSTLDENNEYIQSYFKLSLPPLGFDLYAMASLTEKMEINMRSGACIGCTFEVMINWDDYKANFFKSDGTFDPTIGTGHARNKYRYPDSTYNSISILVKKDLETFGILKPNEYQFPIGGSVSGDKFVILGIALPHVYIQNAEIELENKMKAFMLENNVYHYEYPLKFDEYFFATNDNILAQIKNNNIVRFLFGGEEKALYIKQISIKYGESVLPQYSITLTEEIELAMNKIGQAAADIKDINVLIEELLQKNKTMEANLSIMESNKKTGKFFYYGGTWSDSGEEYTVNDTQAPYFDYVETIHTDSGDYQVRNYYLFNPSLNKVYTQHDMGVPHQGDGWEKMTNDFKYIITDAVFADFAKLGGMVFKGDWMISQSGTIDGQPSTAYQNFDEDYPDRDNTHHNFVPNLAIDGLTGRIYAKSGAIGGFGINDSDLVNTNYDAGVTIQNQYSTKQVVIGSTAIDPKTNRPVPIIAKMTDSGEGGSIPLHNTAIYLEARSATNNYAFHGAGNGVLEGYIQGWKVNQLTSYATTQQLRLRDGAVQAVYRTIVNKGEFWLPRLGEVWETLGILDNQQNTSFCCELVIINQAAVSGNRDDANYYEPRTVKILGETSESRKYWTDLREYSLSYAQDCLPVILRGDESRFLFIDNAYSAHFFLTYINGRYIANYIYG